MLRNKFFLNNLCEVIYKLKRACTGKLKSIKLALHYEVKRFRSWVNLEGPFFLIGNSIHYRVCYIICWIHPFHFFSSIRKLKNQMKLPFTLVKRLSKNESRFSLFLSKPNIYNRMIDKIVISTTCSIPLTARH